MPLEEMSSFFNSRVDMYEEHMLKEVDGASNYYAEIAKLIPAGDRLKLLDLGCGTGLELDEIIKIDPSVQVTGIDLAGEMIKKLVHKHARRIKQLNLIVGDYFKYDFGESEFDIALSVQTLHHFTPEEKIKLYRKIYAGLKPNGFYIEADYMAPTQEFEDLRFAENRRIRAESGIKDGLYHFDIPCTVENQIAMLKTAGFCKVEKVKQYNNTSILLANKKKER
jgi:tRNA (cmo5U34)-methyltransferase